MTSTGKVKVATVVRVSLDLEHRRTQRIGEGVGGGQIFQIQQICNQCDLQVVHQYTATDVPGWDFFRSPQGQDLLRRVRAGELEGIVVSDTSRLLRPDRYVDVGVLDDLAEAGVKIYTSEGVLDPRNKSTAVVFFRGGEALQLLKANLYAKKEALRQAGKWTGGGIPPGIRVTANNDFENAEDAWVIQHVFALFNSGVTNCSELERLTGIRASTVARILRNPIYVGVLLRNEWRKGTYHPGPEATQGWRSKVPRPRDRIICELAIEEPLLPIDDWVRAQHTLDRLTQQRLRARNKIAPYTVFAGRLRCACGERLYTASNDASLYYYCATLNTNWRKRQKRDQCGSHHLRREKLERILSNRLYQHLSNREFFLRLAHTIWLNGLQPLSESRAVHFRNRRQTSSLQRLLWQHEQGYRSDEELRQEMQRLAHQERSLRELLDRHSSYARNELDCKKNELLIVLMTILDWHCLSQEHKHELLAPMSVTFTLRDYEIVGATLPTLENVL